MDKQIRKDRINGYTKKDKMNGHTNKKGRIKVCINQKIR